MEGFIIAAVVVAWMASVAALVKLAVEKRRSYFLSGITIAISTICLGLLFNKKSMSRKHHHVPHTKSVACTILL